MWTDQAYAAGVLLAARRGECAPKRFLQRAVQRERIAERRPIADDEFLWSAGKRGVECSRQASQRFHRVEALLQHLGAQVHQFGVPVIALRPAWAAVAHLAKQGVAL